MLELRQMHAYVEQFEKSRTNLIRQAEAFKQNPALSKDVTTSMRKMIRALETQAAAIEHKMEETIKAHH